MSQLGFSDAEFVGKREPTRREKFLSEMDQVIPWNGLVALIAPLYPRGKDGRPTNVLQTKLRIHFMPQKFGLSDSAMEESLYDIQSMRQFAGLSLTQGSLSDETTILSVRHLLKRNDLATGLLSEGNNWHFGMKVHIGVDAESERVHTETRTPANEHDVTQAHAHAVLPRVGCVLRLGLFRC